jgi:hypothetical protein
LDQEGVRERNATRERSPHGLHLGVGLVLELFEHSFEVMLHFFSGKAVALADPSHECALGFATGEMGFRGQFARQQS